MRGAWRWVLMGLLRVDGVLSMQVAGSRAGAAAGGSGLRACCRTALYERRTDMMSG